MRSFGGILGMQDDTRAALDAETPVNPYSLLEAVNTSSKTANTAWLIFLALMAYRDGAANFEGAKRATA